MKHFEQLKVIKKLAVCGLAMLQIACVQALTPARAYPIAIPAPQTQTLGTIGINLGLMVRDTATQRTLPIYQYHGEYWVAGIAGQGYELSLTSRIADRRVLATTSVDGINVVSGETASTLGRGYVLSSHSTSAVKGWRKSEYEVAAFSFAEPGESYASLSGRPANVGVIGIAVFPELRLPPPAVHPPVSNSTPSTVGSAALPNSFIFGYQNNSSQSSKQEKSKMDAPSALPAAGIAAAPAPAAPAAIADARSGSMQEEAAPAMKRSSVPSVAQGLGTQHGERIASHAPTVTFKRESNAPAEVIQLRYDTAENLVARGVLQWQSVYPAPKPMPSPTPFPKNNYVPDPPRQ